MRCPEALAACDGAVLVVDAAQGIEAQTLANVYLAARPRSGRDSRSSIRLTCPAPTRIGLPTRSRMSSVWRPRTRPSISAKTGLNVDQVLEAIVHKIPAPTGDPKAPLKALIFDSVYDSYKGVIIFCRIKEGTVKKGTTIQMMATGAEEEVVEVGYFGAGQFIPCDELSAGMVGYITASIKNVRRHPGGRYHYRPGQSLRRAAAGLQEGTAYGVLRSSIRRTEPSTRISGTLWRSCS